MSYVASPTASWNPLDYQCPYKCSYCPESGYSEAPRLTGDLPPVSLKISGISVPSRTDLFAPGVPDKIIEKILATACSDQRVPYLFFTKNPGRMLDFLWDFPPGSHLAITVESDIDHHLSLAPPPMERLEALKTLRSEAHHCLRRFQVNVGVQPILDFSPRFLEELKEIHPDQVSIERELMGRPTPQPDFGKVMRLARETSKFSWVLLSGFRVTTRSRFTNWPMR